MSKFCFCHNVFIKSSISDTSKVSICGKRVKVVHLNWSICHVQNLDQDLDEKCVIIIDPVVVGGVVGLFTLAFQHKAIWRAAIIFSLQLFFYLRFGPYFDF